MLVTAAVPREAHRDGHGPEPASALGIGEEARADLGIGRAQRGGAIRLATQPGKVNRSATVDDRHGPTLRPRGGPRKVRGSARDT